MHDLPPNTRRGLFATHYHKLSDEHAQDPHADICHMACRVTANPDGDDQVDILHE